MHPINPPESYRDVLYSHRLGLNQCRFSCSTGSGSECDLIDVTNYSAHRVKRTNSQLPYKCQDIGNPKRHFLYPEAGVPGSIG